MRSVATLILLTLIFSSTAFGQSDATRVESVAREALAAISARDSTAFLALMLDDAWAYSVNRGVASGRAVGKDAVGLAGPGPDLLERMWDPEIQIDGGIATVWTRYDFWVNQEFSHCGTDTFQMLKTKEGWRIASLAYTVQREGCAESPLGRPSF